MENQSFDRGNQRNNPSKQEESERSDNSTSPSGSASFLSHNASFDHIVNQVPATPVCKPAAQIPHYREEEMVVKNLDTGELHDLRNSTVQSMLVRNLSMPLKNELERRLWYAAANNKQDEWEQLLSDYQARFTFINHGANPLHIAWLRGHSQIVQTILDYSFDVDIEAPAKYRQTPLHLAWVVNSLPTIQLLIRSKADLNPQDQNGDTPLHILAQIGDPKTLHYFLGKSPKPYIKNNLGMMPIDMAKNQQVQNVLQSLMLSDEDLLGPQDYKIIRVVGSGSFGKVYLVENSGQQFAMKVLDKAQIVQRNIMRYVITEKTVLSVIDHPFIVKLFRSFQNAGKLFLIMEYWPGGDLSFHLKRAGRFTESCARLYLCQIVLAIEHLHEKDIIYRDLKPANIVIDKDGNAKLADFGLSKVGIKGHTKTKSYWGSVAYLPPEILMKQGHGKAVDWYLVGTLLYEMIIGFPPYYARSKDKLFDNIKSAELHFPVQIMPAAKDLIRKLMHRDPDMRLTNPVLIKQHEFFEGINWSDVQNKLLSMPEIPGIQDAEDAYEANICFENENKTSPKVTGWTFVGKD